MGWRIPFLLSLLLVMFGLWLRRGVEETPTFVAMQQAENQPHAAERGVPALST